MILSCVLFSPAGLMIFLCAVQSSRINDTVMYTIQSSSINDFVVCYSVQQD